MAPTASFAESNLSDAPPSFYRATGFSHCHCSVAHKVQEGTAEDLGDVMSISLKDVVKPTIGFQGALQGAGTPNQAGIGGFLPLAVGENSVWFLDALANVNFADRNNYSSIVDTTVDGYTIST